MRTATLVRRNLAHYRRTNLAVVLGVATAVAVLAGALLVGDSVRASLRDLFLLRLGNTDYAVSAAGFFREQLAGDLESNGAFGGSFVAACPLIATEGLVTHQTSGRRGSGIQVYGVDERFWKFHGREGADIGPGDREILVSESLAQELGSKAGDSILVRVEKASDIPIESLHGRKDDVGRTIRFTMRAALSAPELGEFSLRPHQGPVRAVFVPLRRLQKELEQQGRVNTILVSERPGSADPGLLEKLLRETFSAEDLGIKLRTLEERGCLALESEGGLISDAVAETGRAAAVRLGMRASGVFTYLANTIRSGQREIPYSLVTAIDLAEVSTRFSSAGGAGIVLNEWAARDLGAQPGDTVSLEYYVWSPDGRLLTESAEFRMEGATPIQGAAADRNLAPEYPGITDSKDFSDWDPPFPLDLKRVRPKDEDYWDKYRTTPKAFIPLARGQELWQSRFGKLTSLRIFPDGQGLPGALESYEQSLRAALDPIRSGMTVYPARRQGLEASQGATDFGEYFAYFSFFLVVSALLLAALFFKLGVEQRLREVGTLRAVGFPPSRIRNLFLSEGVVLAAAGSVAGLAGAVAYGGIMMYGLRTWWVDAVGTRLLTLHVSPTSLALGGAAGILTAVGCIAWTLRGIQAFTPRSLLAGSGADAAGWSRRPRAQFAGIASGLLGLALLLASGGGWLGQAAGFFGAGTLLLVAILCFQWVWLSRKDRRVLGGVPGLGFRNATHRPGRSILSITLIASAIFIVVAVDAFRRPAGQGSADPKSGTGGFPLLAESLLPLVYDPNTEAGRENLNLGAFEEVTFVPFRLRPGEDTSCLNLYQPKSPRILAPPVSFLRSGRFSFQGSLAQTAEEEANPWLLLEAEPEDGAIPAIADANSITYVLHLKLGDEIVVNQARLRLVGALSHSLFQGELLISEKNFLRVFPEQPGYRFFLIDAPRDRAGELTGPMEEALSDYGFDIVATAERLAAFDRVENTYLSTFQTLGGLGVLLGTIGLAAVLLRNVLERRRELALLRAVGYRPANLAFMVIAENVLLLFSGVATGTLCALLAIAPAFLARGGQLSGLSVGLLLAAVVGTGLAASLLAVAAVVRSPLLPVLRAE